MWSNSFWQCIVTNYKPNSPPWVEQKQQVKQRNNTPKNLASYANNIQHKELCAHVWDTVQPRAQTVKLWIVIPHWEYLERTKESNQHQCAAREFSRRQGSKKIQAKYIALHSVHHHYAYAFQNAWAYNWMVFSADIQLLKLRCDMGTDVFKLMRTIAMAWWSVTNWRKIIYLIPTILCTRLWCTKIN